MLGSSEDDVLLLEESDETVYVNIRHTKDFRFVAVNTFSNNFSKVAHLSNLDFLILISYPFYAANPS